MEIESKLALLADQMRLEPAEEVKVRPSAGSSVAPCGFSPTALHDAVQAGALETKKNSLGLYDAAAPGGKRITLLKTLLTSACERDCCYCPFRAKRNYRRATFKPEEMAQAFHQMFTGGIAQGLFLSSGVAGGGVRTQDRLIATAEILRRKFNYTGYLHLKIMPGAERDQVWRAMQLADRISINLEAPNAERLTALAPHKNFAAELLRPLQWVEEIRQSQPGHLGWNGRWPSTVTQFVVGAVGESDVEILATSAYLFKTLRLARTYYSAFSPVSETPLESVAAENPWREHRLYQASVLLRDYNFEMEEMQFDPKGALPLDVDPKVAWARAHLTEKPIEVNRADKHELLRIPGIGPKGAEQILAARRRGRLREPRDLDKLGIVAVRAAPFILLDGRRPPQQLALW
ncbi:MAG: helix-hairpin-helix domain-containing protein [Chloroflexi bacterium]|nr:helix-hairpin-helix domain-containing protein [Chloroflexota bacterium]